MIRVILYIILLIFSILKIEAQSKEVPNYKIIDAKIYNEIVKMDSIFFNAYNTCDMEKQAEIYNDNLEFFHDKGGLSTSKTDVLKATERNICNKVTRKLVKNSIEVYPINNYGAVEIGYHQFINKAENNAISNPSKFIVIWKKEQQKWTITKVISLH